MSMYVSNAFSYVSNAIQTVRDMPLGKSATMAVGGGAGLFFGAQAGGLVALYAVEKLASFGVFSEDYKDVTEKGISGIKDPNIAQFVACVLLGVTTAALGAYYGAQFGNAALVCAAQTAHAVAKSAFAYINQAPVA